MRYLLIAIVMALASGCASLVSPDNETRVTEYGGEGNYLMQASGAVAGCRVVQAGTVNGCLKVKTSTCTYTSDGC